MTQPLGRRRFLGLAAVTGVGVGAGSGFIAASILPANAAGNPTIHPTSEWGALPPTSPAQLLNRPPTKLFIHHTDSPNSTDYSLQHGYDLARAIQRDHMNRGWIDTGQQLTLTRGGLHPPRRPPSPG